MRKTILFLAVMVISVAAMSQNILGKYEHAWNEFELYANNQYKYIDKNDSKNNIEGSFCIKDSILFLNLPEQRSYQYIIQDSLHVALKANDCNNEQYASPIGLYKKTKTFNEEGKTMAHYNYKYDKNKGYLLHGKAIYYNTKGEIIKEEKYRNGELK